MKTRLILPLMLIVSFGPLSVNYSWAQSNSDKKPVLGPQHYSSVAGNYLRYLNEKNLEGILSLYADSATVEDPVGSNQLKGMEALRKFYSGAVTIDLNLTRTGPVRVAGVEIAFPFELRMENDGKQMKTAIIDVFRFNEAGEIISMRAFWGPTNREEAKE